MALKEAKVVQDKKSGKVSKDGKEKKRTSEGKEEKKAKKQKTETVVEKVEVKTEKEVKDVDMTDEKAEKKRKKEAKKAAKEAKKEKSKAAEEEAAPASVVQQADEEGEDEEVDTFKVHKKEAPAAMEDKLITCKDCKQEFTFEVSEQEFFKSKGFDPATKVRCRDCTKAKKARFSDGGDGKSWGNDSSWGNNQSWGAKKGVSKCFNCGQEGHMSRDCSEPQKPKGVCYAFQKGECSRGATCKFSHTE
ncbi:MAG: hypothetical protein SGPRY_003488 [Prymnesium sp.]